MSEQLDPCGLTYDECAALAKTYEVRNQAVISLIVANADRLRAERATPAAAAPQQAVPEGWTKERIGKLAESMAVEVAKNVGTVPNLTFPHIYLGLMDALAAPVAAIEQPPQVPIAYVNGDELDNMLDDRTATIQGSPSGWRKTPLYAAPAEQPHTAGAARQGGVTCNDTPDVRTQPPADSQNGGA
jgi:hypothetical protein